MRRGFGRRRKAMKNELQKVSDPEPSDPASCPVALR